MFAWFTKPFARIGVASACLTFGSCSLLSSDPVCAHPSCLTHLRLGASEAEVISGTWLDGEWERKEYVGPVGRDLLILRRYSSISPVAFEDDKLLGWVHRFQEDSWELNSRLRILKGLQSGDSESTARKIMGDPDRVVSFRAAFGDEFEIWSWEAHSIALGFARFEEFDPLEGVSRLEEALILRGYVEGFEDFRAED
ncbi:MAG: hypothetical protein O3A95_05440 [Planctomycetota bacterium]|nr:hypothetical protein [Planctomycetota bacterium]MDA1113729.1 hypothetical protein [Planctomycetota bacterium]